MAAEFEFTRFSLKFREIMRHKIVRYRGQKRYAGACISARGRESGARRRSPPIIIILIRCQHLMVSLS